MRWYSEVKFTDGTPTSCSDRVGNSQEDICHYTQVVWKASTKVGCGKGKATVKTPQGEFEGDFWVCQYSQSGNVDGAFTANVFAPQKTDEECASAVPLPPAPTPAPAVPGCEDGATEDSPVIKFGDGSHASCKDLGFYCDVNYVKEKCKKTCNAC